MKFCTLNRGSGIFWNSSQSNANLAASRTVKPPRPTDALSLHQDIFDRMRIRLATYKQCIVSPRMREGLVHIITHRKHGLFVKIRKFTRWPIQKEPKKM